MPLRRSPSKATKGASPVPLAAARQPLTYDSDAQSERSESSNVGGRTKRKRDDDDISALKTEMRELFSSLSDIVEQRFEEIKQQNSELKLSVQFLSDKYDSVVGKLAVLEEERERERKYVSMIEARVEFLERKNKSTGLEIRNLPSVSQDGKKVETKEEMIKLAKNLAISVNVDLQDGDIMDIYRINSKTEMNKPMIVDLRSVLKKDSILQAVKIFNKTKTKGEKLNSEHLRIKGPTRPVYVSETLTPKAQKLFSLAREFARNNQYAYCWTSKGMVYMRKTEGQPLIRLETEADLLKLKRDS